MLAILGMTIDEVENEINSFSKDGICEISNDNSNSQIVISGEKEVIKKFNENLKKEKEKRYILPSQCTFPLLINEKSW